MCTGREEGSNREMRFTPDLPARRARQKASLPMPLGLTTPIPVMTTRGTMSFIDAPLTLINSLRLMLSAVHVTAKWDN